jgi:cobalamin biosynthesis Mg chelatase CobN
MKKTTSSSSSSSSLVPIQGGGGNGHIRLKSQELAKEISEREEPIIVINSQVSSRVNGWMSKMLGLTTEDTERYIEDEERKQRSSSSSSSSEPRAKNLGIGAKFVPHSHAAVMNSNNPLDKKLKRRIESSVQNQRSGGHSSSSSFPSSFPKGRGGEDDDENEDDSRTKSIGKNKKRKVSSSSSMPMIVSPFFLLPFSSLLTFIQLGRK